MFQNDINFRFNRNQLQKMRVQFPVEVALKSRLSLKGELRPEISLLHMKVLTLIKAKSNVFL